MKDVERALAAGVAPVAAAVPAGVVAVATAEDEVVKMSKMRKVVAERMTASAREIPTVTQDIKVDVRSSVPARPDQRGPEVRISVNDFILKAVAKAIRQHMDVNTSLDAGGNALSATGASTWAWRCPSPAAFWCR